MEFLSEIPIALWIAGFLALYMAWAIGANDVANAMGTSVGSGALTVWGAIMVAAILEFAGAFHAGGHVTDTVRKGMLDLSMMSREQLIYGMLGSLAAAGTLLVVATRFGLPISTTHSIVGAIVGFGAIAIGLDAVKWGKIAQIVLSWVTSPLLAGVIAFFIFQITRLKVLDKPDPIVQIRKLGPVFFFFVFFIIGLVTLFKGLKPLKLDLNLTQSLIGSVVFGLIGAALGAFFIRRVDVGEDDPKHRFSRVERIFVVLQILTACAIAFAHGSNDVANSIGPLAAISHAVQGMDLGAKHPLSLGCWHLEEWES